IRPQNAREKIDLCQVCTTVLPESPRQVLLGKDKSFTFDHVFDTPTQQDDIYNTCVRGLIEGCFEGYNATVFAYGQTGSGKTYTMGTGFDTSLLGGLMAEVTDQVGIVPRAVDHLFLGIEERRRQAFENGDPAPDFKVTAQFMELYNEEILDLLDTTRDPESRGRKSHIRIHEDAGGGIYVVGVNTKPVNSLNETMQCLKSGALGRATASTNMNASSSRSHAIFTLHIRQQRVVKDQTALEEDKETDSTQAEFETLTAKFHFVDLAGSERLKRTGATGDRAKEGISINCGLLALGNVISALGDKAKRGSHVPYRDSKLTRLLQDSLGGNSRTLMIACISPTDQDFMETLNTLKYANRARNIKNKVTANQDKASRQLAALRAEVAALQLELQEYKTGKRTVDADGVESVNDLVVENSMLQSENNKLRQRIKVLQDTVSSMQARSTQMLGDAALASLTAESADGQASNEEVSNMIRKYIAEIEELKTKLTESESLCDQLRRSGSARSPASRMSISSTSFMSSSWAGGGMMDSSITSPSSMDVPSFPSPAPSSQHSVLHKAKKEMKRLKRLQRSQSQHGHNQESDKENVNSNNSEVLGAMEESGVFGEDDQATAVERAGEDQPKDDDLGDEEDDDEEEEDDIDSDSSSSSGSESEDGGESDNVHEDLANLTCEISIKQRLIEELEQTQRRMNSLRTHYEEKVCQLQTRIRETEMERDKVLCNIEKMNHPTADGSKKVKQEYEKKLSNLQDELKKLQAEQRKHAKIQKNNSQYERHLKTLQHEIVEMKKTKVRLMKQVKEEMDKNKQGEARRNREMAQLRKEQLKRENVIKALERQTISSQITKKQTITMLERDMNVWLKQREKCTKELQKYEQREKEAMNSNQPIEAIQRLRATVADLALKVEHAQENINECQSNIMQVEESKEDGEGEDSVEITSMVETMTLEEARYMVRKLCTATLDKGLAVASKDSEVKELQGLLNQTQLNNVLQQELLRHMMDGQVGVEVEGLMAPQDDRDDAEYSSSSSSSSPAESMLESGFTSAPAAASTVPVMQRSFPPAGGPGNYDSLTRREKGSHHKTFTEWIKTWKLKNPWTKRLPSVNTGVIKESAETQARRKTATPQDLLYAGPEAAENNSFTASSLIRLPSQSPSPSPTLLSPTASGDGKVFNRKSTGESEGSIAGTDIQAQRGGKNSKTCPISVSTDSIGGAGGQSSTSAEEETDGGGGAGEDLADNGLLMPPPRLPLKQKSNIPRQSPLPRRREMEPSPVLARKVFHRSTSG
ncbi:kinesin-like protein, partial [Plakobranchus ocellatus]